MTRDQITQLAHSDPVPTIVTRWGEAAAEARKQVGRLENALRALSKVEALLADHDLTVSTDLGPTGNAAASVWRDLQRKKPAGFALPTEQVA